MKTRVIFRVYKGELLALFPAVSGTVNKPWHCSCYAHVGQHSACNPSEVMRHSRAATRAEYQDLARELRRTGYTLQIVKRIVRADYDARVKELAR